MTYGIVSEVPQPVEMYERVNSAVREQLGGKDPDGLLFHVARPTKTGFQVLELWESREKSDRFSDEVLGPIIDRVSGGQAPRREDVSEEFSILGLRGRLASIDLASGQQSSKV